MLERDKRGDRALEDLVRRTPVDPRNRGDPATVVFERGVVEIRPAGHPRAPRRPVRCSRERRWQSSRSSSTGSPGPPAPPALSSSSTSSACSWRRPDVSVSRRAPAPSRDRGAGRAGMPSNNTPTPSSMPKPARHSLVELLAVHGARPGSESWCTVRLPGREARAGHGPRAAVGAADAGLEPAHRPGADAAEDDAGAPRLPHDFVQAMGLPEREQIHEASPSDIDQVLPKQVPSGDTGHEPRRKSDRCESCPPRSRKVE